MASECAVCGRPTGPGAQLYVGRRLLPSSRPAPAGEHGEIVELDEPTRYLCADCDTPASPATDSFKEPSNMIGAGIMNDALLHRGHRRRR